MQSLKRPDLPIENLSIGKVIEVDGSRVVAELDSKIFELSRIHAGEPYPIGQFGSITKIHFGRRVIYAFVGRLRMKAEYEIAHGATQVKESDARVIELHLFGEGEWSRSDGENSVWRLNFERGVSTFPLPQQTVYLTPVDELKFIFGNSEPNSLEIGNHVGTGGTACFADLNELLGKHTAILGSTGSGKSCAVAAIIHSILARGTDNEYTDWHPRIIILDPHNEYSSAFKAANRLSTDEGTLRLPYWLLNLQETIALMIGKTEFAATSQTNIVKNALLQSRLKISTSIGIDNKLINVDSPVPYSLADFKAAIESQRPSNNNQKDHEPFLSVLAKLDLLQRDSRLGFMMNEWTSKKDEFADILFQLIGGDEHVKVVDFSGVPNEVAGIASSVIARIIFNCKVWQTENERKKDPVLLICEEAHRYVPNKGEALYEAAQEAIRRLAKEGRKYGVGLFLVSQRPSEVDATVLSQCNSWVVLRITNEADKNHVRSVLPDSLEHMTKILSGLRKREAIFAGQASMLPSRILIRQLQDDERPRSDDMDFDKGWQNKPSSSDDLTKLGNRWRYQKRI